MQSPDLWRWRWTRLREKLVKRVAHLRNERLRPGQRQTLRYEIMAEENQSFLKDMKDMEAKQPPEPDPVEEN